MKHLPKILLSAAAATAFASCEPDKTSGVATADAQYQAILAQYVDYTVVPTYKAMAEAALEMRAANSALRATPSDANMQAASAAWMKARVEWEKSEAFLFGPVGEDGFDIDGHIDSWPLELEAIKASIADGGDITGAAAWRLDAEVIGFHTTEYLLYREGKTRRADDLTAAELKYLTAATDALVWDCVLAYVAWVGLDKVDGDMPAAFGENAEVVALLSGSSYKSFAATLKSASGKYQGDFGAALSEISDGCADIAGEVGAIKIAAPFGEGKVEEVESWYSWHSLEDYQNNIISIKNAYYGGRGLATPHASSLSAYVASQNPTLDGSVKAKIDDCIAKIAAIGAGGKSFYEVVLAHANEAAVGEAVDACAELEALFKQISSNL
jgi:uncharacterized iron-regulated protein